MLENLLATKVHIPPLRPKLIPRSSLIQRLNEGMQPGVKLTLVSAPPGYGKTTALIQWSHSSALPVGWVSLEKADDDFDRFFRYLILAWEQVQPGILKSPPGILLGGLSPNREAVIAAIINLANNLDQDTAFVFDDFHLIEDPAILEGLTFLLDHPPPKLHLYFLVRGEPLLPLARYRAHSQLVELIVSDLQFSLEEAEILIKGDLDFDIAAASIAEIHEQLEGWAVGLRLATIALKQGLMDPEQAMISSRQRFISEYLRQEVFGNLPQDTREFLLQTSILEALCASLCDAVTDKQSGEAMLGAIEKEGLFLTPLDDQRQWFRYHSLFGDFLKRELQSHHPDNVTLLHRRAAAWYLANELFEPAFDHAIAGNDSQLIAQIAENRFGLMLHIGQHRLLSRWLDVLPEHWQFQHPVIGLTQAIFYGMSGSVTACINQLNKVEQAILESDREDTRWQLARVTTIRCNLACYQNDLLRAEPLAEKALRDLPKSDQNYRATVHHSLGEAYRHVGRWQRAREEYHKSLALVQQPGFQYRSIHVYGALADVEFQQGQLREAMVFWEKALSAIEASYSWGYLPLPLTGWVYIRTAEIQYEWNQLQRSLEYLEQGIERAEVGGVIQSLIVGYLVATRWHLTHGDLEKAENYLEQTRPLLQDAHFHHWIGRFDRLQLELWLAQDKLRTAVNWTDQMLQDENYAQQPYGEITRLTLSRGLIFRGDSASIQQGLDLLADVETFAVQDGRIGIQTEALAIQALAHNRLGDSAKAMIAIDQALRLAEPEGYIRLFVDLGIDMVEVLLTARSRKIMPDYLEELLAVCNADSLVLDKRPLPEPLTDREVEILDLIAAGLTNREIANQLFISPETVKKHAGNIFSKLNASSRTEAAAIARDLNLLT